MPKKSLTQTTQMSLPRVEGLNASDHVVREVTLTRHTGSRHALPMGEGIGFLDGYERRAKVKTRIVSQWPARHPLC
jgi:hypothetical protein